MRLLADHVELALEGVLIGAVGAPGDEHLPDGWLSRYDALAEAATVARHVTPAKQKLTLRCHELGDGSLTARPRLGVPGQKNKPGCIRAGSREHHAELCALLAQEDIRDLNEDPCPVACQVIGAHRTAVVQIDENLEPPTDDLMTFAILDIGNKADAARIVLAAWIIKTQSMGGTVSGHRDVVAC